MTHSHLAVGETVRTARKLSRNVELFAFQAGLCLHKRGRFLRNSPISRDRRE